MASQRKPFQIKTHHKYDFRDWVQDQFPELGKYRQEQVEYPDFSERFHEIHSAAMSVLDIIMARSALLVRQYYEQDLENLRLAYQERDKLKYARHLDAFVSAIDVE